MAGLLTININIDPNIGTFGPFQITWHGVFTAVAIAAAVIVSAYFARLRRLNEDDVYNIALWGVPGGIVGARLLYVLEHANTFKNDLGGVISVNEGGISIYGGVIGGAIVAFAYAYRKHLPVRRFSDCGALGLLIGQAVGRLGDTINGEHWAKASNLPWAFCYTNPNTLNGDPTTQTTAICGSISQHPLNPPAVHPVAGLYEPLGLLLLFGLCWWLFRRLKVAGYVFWIYVIGYAVLRFVLSPLRINEQKIGNFAVPQLIAIAMAVVGLIGLYVVRKMAREHPDDAGVMQPAPVTPVIGSGTAARPRRT